MACGNNHISRSTLHSAPVAQPPKLREIHVRLPRNNQSDRLKADVWTTTVGTFQDRAGVTREFPGVTSPRQDRGYVPGQKSWDFCKPANVSDKAYTHMVGRAGWLGPESIIGRLPVEAAKALHGRRSVVLGTRANQTWVNERNTTFDSQNRRQTTVVRPLR